MKLAGAGHRPPKIGGYDRDNPLRTKIRARMIDTFEKWEPEEIISGMALGFDQDLADVALYLAIPLIAAVPCPNQDIQWPAAARRHYAALIEAAREVHIISPRYDAGCMQERNCWMVDRCDHLLALWDGSSGGTRNCILYADAVGRLTTRWDPSKVLATSDLHWSN